MNLHGIVSPFIASVNPLIPVTIRISDGANTVTASDGSRTPAYATPAAFTAAIAGTIMTVSAVASGKLLVGQTVAGAGVADETLITGLGSGSGGVGTYIVGRSQDVDEDDMTSSLVLNAQIQPISSRDLQHLDGLNLNGTMRSFYLYGAVDCVTRVTKGGGDLIDVAAGSVNDGTWLVNQVIEQFPDWVKAACTLQNE